MPVGDSKKLDWLIANLHRAGDRAAPAAAARCAKEVSPLLGGEYRRAEDPDGAPWAPLRRGTGKPLRGVMEGQTSEPDGPRVVVRIPHVGAFYSQHGTPRQQARRLLPMSVGVAGLPPRWRSRLVPAARGAVLQLLRQGTEDA